jgi:ABC-type lipoprotein export system ATPase subunit
VLVTHERDIAQFARRIVSFRDGLIAEDRVNSEPGDAHHLLETSAA